jgi:AcrR family transcriptional regulator
VTRPRTPKPRLGRPPSTDSADTRRRLLDIARVAFAERGFDAATNRNLGQEAGITAGAIYHYFGSKLDLYAAVHEDVRGLVYGRLGAAAEPHSTFRGKIEAILDCSHDMNKEDPSLAQFLGSVRVDMRRNAELGASLREAAVDGQSFFDDIVEFGVRTGEILPADRVRVAALVRTLLVGLTDGVSGSVTAQSTAIDAIKLLLDGALIHPPKKRAAAARATPAANGRATSARAPRGAAAHN